MSCGSILTQFLVGIYTYPCNSNLQVALMFGDRYYDINMADFNLGMTSETSTYGFDFLIHN